MTFIESAAPLTPKAGISAAEEYPNAQAFSAHSAEWTLHFEQNLCHMDHVPWDRNQLISTDQRDAIAKSIATFQLGENAEGNAFKRAGRAYAERTGDFEYLKALKLFIEEEQSHSAVLGRFMDQQNIPRIEKEWTDSTFRYIRRLAGLNVCITVLITAEIIAAVYYEALRNATESPVLRAICDQILIDEAHHLKFQGGVLAKERSSWNPVKRWLFRQLHRVLLLGTILVVWKEHRSVYRAGRLGFFRWTSKTWAVLEEVLVTIDRGIETKVWDTAARCRICSSRARNEWNSVERSKE
ncbi:MAG: hypothetical protein AB8B55_21830 [Mariniblastus sp.]